MRLADVIVRCRELTKVYDLYGEEKDRLKALLGLRANVKKFPALRGVTQDFHRGESAYDRYYGDPTNKPNPNLGALEHARHSLYHWAAEEFVIHCRAHQAFGVCRQRLESRILARQGLELFE